MRKAALIFAVAGVLAASACGGSSPTGQAEESGGETQATASGFEEVLGQVEGLEGKERRDKLAELAQEEGGELNLYTSLTSDVADAVAGEFEDAYDIDVAVYRAGSETVLQRLTEEAKAGFAGADVTETNGPELANLAGAGIVVPYEPSPEFELAEGAVHEGWTATRFNKFVVSWNTNLVPEGTQPKSWEELADPKWDGKVALELGDVEWYKSLFDYWVEQGKSEDEAQGLFEDMARGGLSISGHTVMGELMAGGEFAAGASNYSYLVQNLVDDGAPVSWQPAVEPLVSRPNGVGLVKGARHPATAMLFEEWLLSEGQPILVEHNVDVARTDLSRSPGVEEIFVDVEGFVAEQDEWIERYEQLMRLTAEAEQ